MLILLHVAAVGAFYVMLAGLDYSNRTRIVAVLLFALVPLHWDANLAAAATIASLACFAHGQRTISLVFAAGAMYASAGPAVVLPGVVALLAFLYCSQPRRRGEVWRAVIPYLPLAAASLAWHVPYALPHRTAPLAIGMIVAAVWVLAALNMESLRDQLLLCGALTWLPLATGNPYLAATGVCLLSSQLLHLGHPPGNQ